MMLPSVKVAKKHVDRFHLLKSVEHLVCAVINENILIAGAKSK